jgi:hypothetical protein
MRPINQTSPDTLLQVTGHQLDQTSFHRVGIVEHYRFFAAISSTLPKLQVDQRPFGAAWLLSYGHESTRRLGLLEP